MHQFLICFYLLGIYTWIDGRKYEVVQPNELIGRFFNVFLHFSPRVTGWIITWKVEEDTHGKTGGNMKESINKIKKMDLDCIYGQMVDNMRDSGNQGNNTVKGNMSNKMG